MFLCGMVNAQVFTGKGDQKFQVGANIQDHGTGIMVTYDRGLGKNFSVGLVSSYLLGVEEVLGEKPDFEDRFDLKARFNANIADVFNIEEKVDIYPGLDLGLKNFGGHLGARYYFTDGFGVFSEMQFPIAKYDSDVVGFEKYNNQFNFSIGASFNL
ncbi:hypothetical protein SAMN05444337_0939 [Flavobacterium haoranii]|uniref:Outer membrane protein beta-barrel domain-containing protein n=1 Tax=Flavobacterium haoranii TaxID=683124 RepID=A0A1M6EGK4_9FLAO|nr:hypothetical protein SAMN05444337_0939 [Flavobacterium haoranii]